MSEQPSPLRLRAGGSVVLPEGSTEADIDNAGRQEAVEHDEKPTPKARTVKPKTPEQT